MHLTCSIKLLHHYLAIILDQKVKMRPKANILSLNLVTKDCNKSCKVKMTDQAALFCFSAVASFCFSNGRTDTTSENSNHLFGRGLVGQ